MKALNILKKASLLAVAAVSLSSCLHKDLCFDHSHRVTVYEEFDWRNAPDADPTSMLTYYFPSQGEVLTYTFAGRDGGEISLPFGSYSAISISGDNTYWGGLRNTDDPARFELYTKDAEQLRGYGLQTRSLPRAKGAETERIAMTPGMVWSDRQDNILLKADAEGDQYIRFYPEETVCHYTVDIYDVKNIGNLHGSNVDATLSGMAEGYLHGQRKTTDVAVTMPFTLTPSAESASLHGEFLTFGECDTNKVPHQLTVYMYLVDGTKWYHTFDVTQQVAGALDPKHVHIIIEGLDLPQPISGGGGFVPDVNEWNDIQIDLQM